MLYQQISFLNGSDCGKHLFNLHEKVANWSTLVHFGPQAGQLKEFLIIWEPVFGITDLLREGLLKNAIKMM